MKENKLNFESENFVVHYITLNLRETVDKKDLRPIAKYLSDHCNFNSTLFIEATGLKESFYSKPSNKYEIEFRIYYYNPKVKNFWEGTQIHFKGESAIPLYELIKNQKFQWDIFHMEKLKIGRFRKLSGKSNTLNEQYTEADAKFLVSEKTLQHQADERRRLGQKNPNKMSMYEQGKNMGYSIVSKKYKHCNPNKTELSSSPANVKHIINALELLPSERNIVKKGIIDGAKSALSDKLKVPESSISDQTALQEIIFMIHN